MKRTIAALILALGASTASAEPIDYLWTGTGSFVVNGTPYTDKPFSIALTGDTTATYPWTANVTANAASGSINIFSVGTYYFSEPNLGIFISQAGPVLGFWRLNTYDYLDAQAPDAAGWDAATRIGPIDMTPGAPTQFTNVPTDGGPITMTAVATPLTFEAIIACPATPSLTCSDPGKGSLSMQGSTKPQLKWKWTNGTASFGDFGSPVTVGTDSYQLCIYYDDAPAAQLRVASRGTCGTKPCWSTDGASKAKYKNKLANSDGITGVKFQAGTDEAKIQVVAKGPNLPPLFPVLGSSSVKVQLWRYSTGGSSSCWQTLLPSPAKKYDALDQKFSDTTD